MRKLVHCGYDFQIDLSDGNLTALFFDKPEEYRHFAYELVRQYDGEDGNFVLSEDGEEIPFSDNLVLVSDLLRFGIDDKKILNKLQSLLKAFAVSEDMFQKTHEIICAIDRYAEDLVDSFQYQLRYESIEAADLIKLLNLRPEYDYQNELEHLAEYMNLFHDICGIGAFVIFNGFSIYSDDEISLLADDARRQGHAILFIEGNSASSYRPISASIRKLIVDKDMVELC